MSERKVALGPRRPEIDSDRQPAERTECPRGLNRDQDGGNDQELVGPRLKSVLIDSDQQDRCGNEQDRSMFPETVLKRGYDNDRQRGQYRNEGRPIDPAGKPS